MRRRGTRAGTALVEFAMSLILLASMFAGIFQTGYTFYAYSTLVNAVRSGARYASIAPREARVSAEFASAVRNLVVYGDPKPAAGAKPVVAGLQAANVEVIFSPGAATVALRGFEINAVFSKIKLEGKPTATFPYTGGGAK